MKKILGCILFAVLILSSTGKVFAAEQPDFSQKGSINVYMRAASGTLVAGGSLEVYKVADVYSNRLGNKYVYTSAFAGSGYAIGEEGFADLAMELLNYALDNDIHGDLYENTTGIIKLNHLTSGLYLIDNNKAPEGYNRNMPFLVSLPFQVGDTWLYEVDASPKMSLLNQKTLPPVPAPTPDTITDSEGKDEEDWDDEDWDEIIAREEGKDTYGYIKSPATGDKSGIVPVIMIGSFLLCIALRKRKALRHN